MIIDAHQHFWRLSRGDYGWLTADLAPLHRDFEPADLAPLMKATGVVGSIVVQAAPTEAETAFLLDLAERAAWPMAVIGWTDLTAPGAPARIRALAREPRLKGLRPMLQDLADDDFVLRPAVAPALEAMVETGLIFEALVRPRHLPRLLALRARYAELRVVVDHAGKPDIAGGAWAPWADDMSRLADDGQTHCKLSGLITEAGSHWTVETLAPYADLAIDAFGPDRVMWGSDWPVALLAGGYQAWLAATRTLLAGRPAPDQAAILGGNAQRLYGLDVAGPARP